MPNERQYTVGKGKPPEHTRFQKGQSGNPTGRRKGSKNVATLLEQVLNERVVVTENGKRKTHYKAPSDAQAAREPGRLGRPPRHQTC